MSKISLKMLCYTEDALQDERDLQEAFDVDGVHLQLICVDNIEDMIFELDDKVFEIVLISDPLINTSTLEVIRVLDSRQQQIPRMVLAGSLDDFSAVAALEATGTLQAITKTTMGTMLLMTHREMKKRSDDFDDRLRLKRRNTETLNVIGGLVELRDKDTQGHTLRVTALAVKLARKLGMPKAEVVNLQHGALIHDMGKVGIPDSILLKEGKLTESEWVIMKTHPTLAYGLLVSMSELKNSIDIPYCHHEKWNGSGYPRGLIGKAIPLPARIFSIVDVFDALTSERPYRPAWTKEATLAHIESLSGIAFDPAIVPVFIELMRLEK